MFTGTMYLTQQKNGLKAYGLSKRKRWNKGKDDRNYQTLRHINELFPIQQSSSKNLTREHLMNIFFFSISFHLQNLVYVVYCILFAGMYPIGRRLCVHTVDRKIWKFWVFENTATKSMQTVEPLWQDGFSSVIEGYLNAAHLESNISGGGNLNK